MPSMTPAGFAVTRLPLASVIRLARRGLDGTPVEKECFEAASRYADGADHGVHGGAVSWLGVARHRLVRETVYHHEPDAEHLQ